MICENFSPHKVGIGQIFNLKVNSLYGVQPIIAAVMGILTPVGFVICNTHEYQGTHNS